MITNTAFTDVAALKEALGVDFSPEQEAAITAPLVPTVIIAGAGTGKTTVMAARVVWMVGTGKVSPDRVLGLTFTRKAAGELAERIDSALARAGLDTTSSTEGGATVQTYDSFANELVSDYGERLGLDSGLRLITDAGRFQLASRVVADPTVKVRLLARFHPDTLALRLLSLESALRSHLCDPEQLLEQGRRMADRLSAAPTYGSGRVYKDITSAIDTLAAREELLGLVESYRRMKDGRGLAEFADQMQRGVALAQRLPAVGAELRQRFRLVLLDEYQDTSAAQASLLQALFSGPDPNRGQGHPVTAVGDPLQAIYGWRGAASANVLTFAEQFLDRDGGRAASYPLSVNRRSGSDVLAGANLISATMRADTDIPDLCPPQGSGVGSVHVADFTTRPMEIDWLAEQVAELHRLGQVQRWSDIAVLIRVNRQAGPLYQALVARDIPVEIVGLGGLLQVSEVVHVVATLRVMANPGANTAVGTLLSGPRWRLGPADLAALGRHAKRQSMRRTETPESLDAWITQLVQDLDPVESVALMDAVRDPDGAGLSAEASQRVRAFATEIAELSRHSSEPLPDVVRRVIRTIGLDVELAAIPGRGPSAERQLRRFVAAVDEFLAVDGTSDLPALLAWLDAELDQGHGLDLATPTADDSVKLLSVHKAKGLEWEVVFLPHLVQGTFPSTRLTDNWVNAAHVLPAELRGDAAAYPQLTEVTKPGLEDYRERLSQELRTSEDRLAYVAVTRAKQAVYASRSRWRVDTKKPDEPSDYWVTLHEIAARTGHIEVAGEPGEEINPIYGTTEPVPWPEPVDEAQQAATIEAANWVRAQLKQAPPGQVPVGSTSLTVRPTDGAELTLEEARQVAGWSTELQRLLAEAASRRGAVNPSLPPSISASALIRAGQDPAAFRADLVRPMPRHSSWQARLGSRFHAWLERRSGLTVALLDPEDLFEDKDAVLGETRADDTEEAAFRRLCRAFERGAFADRVPLAVEVPFVLVLGDQQIRGRIDAVFADVDGVGYQIVDWKTSNAPMDPVQLAIYRLAWSRAQRIPVDSIDAVYYHVLSDSIERPSEFMDEAGLRAVLTAAQGAEVS